MANVINTNFKYAKPLIPLDLDNVKYIILHHPEAEMASPEQIHQWHLENDWAGFAYNEYIRKDGTVIIGRGDFIGAQCAGMNSSSYGICCEGNYEVETTMPEAQLKSVIERIAFNKARFKNYKCTAPHSQFGSTACPGKYFPLARILKESEVNFMEQPHWAEETFRQLTAAGIKINEKRFEDPIKRGEAMALLLQLLNLLTK